MGRQRFILTGATGFLGSHLMAALLGEGHEVLVMARPRGQESPEHRIMKLIRWFGIDEEKRNIKVYGTDFTKPLIGLPAADYAELCSTPCRIIHCASDTRFSECYRDEIIRTNVGSIPGLIRLARDCNASGFIYVSTAYAAGCTGGLCIEELPVNLRFTNIYEETKATAENMVVGECSEAGIPWTILRPSIVYGDSGSGRSNVFNALYWHVKSLFYLKEIYVKDIRLNKGMKAGVCGIGFEPDGSFRMPLNIFLPCDGMINLIPVDYFVKTAMQILENNHQGKIFHITGDKAKSFTELAGWCEEFVGFKGIQIHFSEKPESFRYTPAESIFNKLIEPYIPYFSDKRTFDRKNTRSICPGHPPDLDYPLFFKCMEYAVRAKWTWPHEPSPVLSSP